MGCPICKSNTAIEVRKPTFGVKGNAHIDHYECDGCSVIFEDKDKFHSKSANRDKKQPHFLNIYSFQMVEVRHKQQTNS